MTKKLKRVFSLFLAILMVASMPLSASAASISSNKKKATGIYCGQTIYVTTNSTIFSKVGFATDITITSPKGFYDSGFYGDSHSHCNSINMDIYKKTGTKWVKLNPYKKADQKYVKVVKSASLNIRTRVTSWQIKLLGKGTQYKIQIKPTCCNNSNIFDCTLVAHMGCKKMSDFGKFTATLDYGKITKVA